MLSHVWNVNIMLCALCKNVVAGAVNVKANVLMANALQAIWTVIIVLARREMLRKVLIMLKNATTFTVRGWRMGM